MDRPLRVALLVNWFPALSETFIYSQAAQLSQRGLDVTVITHSAANAAAAYEDYDGLRFEGTVRRAANVRRPGAWTSVARAVPGTASFARQARRLYGSSPRALRAALLASSLDAYDVAHFEFTNMSLLYLDPLPLLGGTATVVSCRGSDEQIRPLVDPKRRDALRALFAAVDRVHCVTSSLQKTCEGYGLDPTRAFVNRPAVDSERFRRRTPYDATTRAPLRLLSVSRLDWCKGLEFGVMAVRELLDRGLDVRYDVVGGGEDEARLRVAIDDLDLGERVTLHGRESSTQVRERLEHADVLVFPSVREGFGNVLLESMAMEVPVVTADFGGVRELVDDGENGLVVPTRDHRALADAVGALAADPARRLEIGRNGRRTVVERFGVEAQTDRFVELYRELATRD